MRQIKDEAELQKRHERIGEFVDALGNGIGVRTLEGGRLVSVKVRLPTEEEPAALLIVEAAGTKGEFVMFVGAFGVGDALLAWRAREQSGKCRWRVSLPWEPPEAGDK